MLSALAAIVILFQAAPDAAAAPGSATSGPKLSKMAPAAPAASSTFETTALVKAKATEDTDTKTLSPIEVQRQRELKDEIAKRELVCNEEKPIGSILPKKICATKEEVADRKAFDQSELRKAQALRPYKAN